MNICSTNLKLKKCLTCETLIEFWKLNATCNISPECEGERNDHMLHYEQVFGKVFERRESKYCGVLMKNRRKVKDEQVITLQMSQQLKTKILILYQDN